MKQLFSNNITAILVTLALHLALLVVFFSVKISDFNKAREIAIEIEFPKDELPPEIEEILDPSEMADRVLRKNIGVNVAEKLQEDLSTEKYAEELQKALNEGNPDRLKPEDIQELQDKLKAQESIPIEKASKPASSGEKKKYFGPTNIEYYLPGRHDLNLYVPVYLCEGYGKVTVNISVNQEGYVIGTSISSKSEVKDECLYKASMEAATRTRFNIDLKASSPQKGTITYNFVAQ